uniref:Protein kinase domain-containing protein n=1 Tax=Ditylenchus dipsaci TaxID=166011 RepID=A0A915E8Y7_9BILA
MKENLMLPLLNLLSLACSEPGTACESAQQNATGNSHQQLLNFVSNNHLATSTFSLKCLHLWEVFSRNAHLPTIKPMEQNQPNFKFSLCQPGDCHRQVVEQQRVAELQLQWFHQPNGPDTTEESGEDCAGPVGSTNPEDDLDQHKRFCPTTSLVERTVSSSSSSGPEDSSDEVAIVECQNGGISTSGAKSTSSQLASSGQLIASGRYEIVGDGRECKAVDMHSKTIFHACLICFINYYEIRRVQNFLTVLGRLKIAESLYNDVEEYSTLKNLLIPDETQAIQGENGNSNWYVLLPDHQGNLHSLTSGSCSNGDSSPKVFSERRIQPIFKQIVALVEFCHRIGIYFRDFRLRKFVFTDKERTQIRLNNVLDVWVAPQIDVDQISQRLKSQVCPVYISPEILVAGVYAGRPADVWALGVLLFSLLIGRYPFNDPNPTALFKRIKARRFSCPVSDGISHNARWLLYGLLRQSPSDRPTAAEILQSHWLKTEPEALPDGRECRSVPSKGMNGLTMSSQSVFSSSISGPREPQPPAFVRLGGNLTLQQAAPTNSSTAIHVRLALVSTSQGPTPQLPPQLHREAPNNCHLLPPPVCYVYC